MTRSYEKWLKSQGIIPAQDRKPCKHVRPRASCMNEDCRERWLAARRSHELFLSNIRRLDEERRAREAITRHDEMNISEITGHRFRF